MIIYSASIIHKVFKEVLDFFFFWLSMASEIPCPYFDPFAESD